MTRVLYLARTGLAEPLGQSQILGYLRGLSRHHDLILVTFERAEDFGDAREMARLRALCEAHAIDWRPQRMSTRPRVLGPARDLARMLRLAWRAGRSEGIELIHARSYLPAAAALAARAATGVPFLFDMRALWPEELIVAGRLRRGGPIHRAIRAAERACLRRAAAVISLSEAAAEHLRRAHPRELEGQRMVVIPTCADLDRFSPKEREARDGPPRVIGAAGTMLSGWFRTDWLSALLARAAARWPDCAFEIATRDDASAVRAALDPDGRLGARLRVFPARPEEMPDILRRHDVSAMFYADGVSRIGSAPTRLAEVLGCGRPVIVNAGVGDVGDIVGEDRVGVVMEGPAQGQVDAALGAFEALRADPGTPARCRASAEARFSLERGTAAYDALYRQAARRAGAELAERRA